MNLNQLREQFPNEETCRIFLNQPDGLLGASALTVGMINRGSFELHPIDKGAMNAHVAPGSLRLLPKRHCMPPSCHYLPGYCRCI